MLELVERYIYQVGRYLPENERDDILNELRSLIQDQVEDRFAGEPTDADIATILTELGAPDKMAASYGSPMYLIGPEHFLDMVRVLQRGWVVVPVIVVLLNVIGAFLAEDQGTLIGLFFDTLFTTILAVLSFTALVIMVFAAIQWSDTTIDKPKRAAFDPLDLPPVHDPAKLDRAEIALGASLVAFFTLVAFYFLQVGGLTLRFDLNDPGDVIPAPRAWMGLLIVASVIQIALMFNALRRGRWEVGTMVLQILAEAFGAVCIYFAFWLPLGDHYISENTPWILKRVPEMILVATLIITVLNEGSKLIRIWRYQTKGVSPLATSNQP